MAAANTQRLIRKAVILPRVALASLAAAFLVGLLAIVLAMIDGVFLESDDLALNEVIGAGVVMVACGIVCIASFLMARRAARDLERIGFDRPDDSIAQSAVIGGLGVSGAGRIAQSSDNPFVEAAGNAAEIAGMATSAAGVAHMMKSTGDQASRAAAALGQTAPSARPYVAATLIIPCLLVVAVFIPRFIDTARTNEADQIAAAQTVTAVCNALEARCEDVYADDPIDQRNSSGYRVHGSLRGYDAERNAKIAVYISKEGIVEKVVYNIDVDISRSADATREQANRDITALARALSAADVKIMADGLLNTPSIPDEFVTRIENDSYYQEFTLDIEDTGDLCVWMVFSTDTREEFDEYSDPSIHLYLNADE